MEQWEPSPAAKLTLKKRSKETLECEVNIDRSVKLNKPTPSTPRQLKSNSSRRSLFLFSLSFFLSFFAFLLFLLFILFLIIIFFWGRREGGVKAGLQTMAAIPSESTKKRSSQRLKVMSRIRHRWLKNHRRSSNAGGRRSKVKLWPIFKLGQDLKESHRVAFSWDLSDLSLFILRV